MRVRPSRPARWLVALLALLLLAPATASAAVRSGEVQDPQDTNAGSGPMRVDIQAVQASYDPAGSLTVAVTLHTPWERTTRDYPSFQAILGSTRGPSPLSPGSCATGSSADITVAGTIEPSVSPGVVFVDGFTPVFMTRTASADGRTTTFSAASPLLANRNPGCVARPHVYAWDSEGHCVPSTYWYCDHISHIWAGDETADFFFAGYAPPVTECSDGVDNDGDGDRDRADFDCTGYDDAAEAGPGRPKPWSPTFPPPNTTAPPLPDEYDDDDAPARLKTVCSDGKDNDGDGKTDRKDPGCLDIALGTSEVDPRPVRSRSRIRTQPSDRSCSLVVRAAVFPELLPKRLFPLGRATLSIKGLDGLAKGFAVTRKLRLASSGKRTLKGLAPGRYRVSMSYAGDPWRRASKATGRTVHVC